MNRTHKLIDIIQSVVLAILTVIVGYALITGQISFSPRDNIPSGGSSQPQEQTQEQQGQVSSSDDTKSYPLFSDGSDKDSDASASKGTGSSDDKSGESSDDKSNGSASSDSKGGKGNKDNPGAEKKKTVLDEFGNVLDPDSAHVTLDGITVYQGGWYYHMETVALYIHHFGVLPDNFVTKTEAKRLGWSGGSVEKYQKGAAIGGSQFTNSEGSLPKAKGRVYTECDIDTLGESVRGAHRIVFSNDGLIFYTDDHYDSFTLLYDSNGKQY